MTLLYFIPTHSKYSFSLLVPAFSSPMPTALETKLRAFYIKPVLYLLKGIICVFCPVPSVCQPTFLPSFLPPSFIHSFLHFFIRSFIHSLFLPSFNLRSGELETYCKLHHSKTLCRAVWYVLADFYLADKSTNFLQQPVRFYLSARCRIPSDDYVVYKHHKKNLKSRIR